MTTSHKLALTLALSLLTAAPLFAADAPTTAPAATTQRSPQAILTDLRAANVQFHQALSNPKDVADPKFRADNAAKIIPLIQKLTSLMNEFAATQSAEQQAGAQEFRIQILGLGAALGDKDSAKILTDLSADKNPETALSAQSSLALGNWIAASADPKAQQKVLDTYTTLAKANPENPDIAQTLMMMNRLGAANDDLAKNAVTVLRTDLKGPAAQEILADLDAENAQKEMIGKPLAVAARTSTNDKFDSASLKGKVVMLDFWATWCGPCREELPRVKALYKTYHDQGFEIVGLDCDGEDDTVNAFTKQNEMPWLQLRETSQTASDNWHPLANKYGVKAIPVMFLLDKKGVLRYTDARENTEQKIKTLLAEPSATQPAK